MTKHRLNKNKLILYKSENSLLFPFKSIIYQVSDSEMGPRTDIAEVLYLGTTLINEKIGLILQYKSDYSCVQAIITEGEFHEYKWTINNSF